MIDKIISHYKIIEKLGEGGMGEVYLADDLKLERQVAIKFLPEHLTKDKENVERFEREAKATAALNHPNIVTIYEIAEEDDQTFIVMEYVDGDSLREKIDKGILDIDEILNITKQICEGLTKAHQADIVHRDIKPENIIINEDGRVKILDFGLAKLKGVSKLTKETSILGTIHYMSPQQIQRMEVDQRCDIWSLGVIIYEMLTGQVPFKGDYESAVIYSVLNESVIPLSSIRSDVPKCIEDMVNKALEKQLDKRYQTIEEILKELECAPGDTQPNIVEKSIAVLPFSNMSADPEQEYFCDGMAEEIINSLTQLEELHVVARTSSFVFKGKHLDIREIGKKLNVNYVLEGSVRKAGNRLRITAQLIKVCDGYHLWSERFECEMDDLFAIQDETTLAIVKKLKVKLGSEEKSLLKKRYTENLNSYNLYLKGRFYWSTYTEEGFKKGIYYYEQAIARDPNYALAFAGIAICNTFLGYYLYLNPKQEFEKAESAAQKALDLDENLAEAHLALAWVKMSRDWDWVGAQREFRRAIELNPGYAIGHAYYAALLSVLGRYQEAIAEAEWALNLDPLSPLTGATTGLRYYYARNYERAIDEIKKILDMMPQFAPGYWMLALPLAVSGRIKEAVEAVDKSLELLSDLDPLSLAIRGVIYALSPEKQGDARQIIEQLLELSQNRPISAFFMGMIYIGLEEKDQVFTWFDKAYQEREPLLMWARPDPIVQDGLQSDPRYKNLLAKMGLGK
jgi:serine/threonine protein kinase/Flp pilus assembly protein TadD